MTLLKIDGLVTEFGRRRSIFTPFRPPVKAVDDVSFHLDRGDILGIVGESGSGKSTLAKTILGLYRERAGSIVLEGRIVSGLDRHKARKARADIQYVHQDPGAALDPWWRVRSTLDEALIVRGTLSKTERDRKIDAILDAVGLHPSISNRYPHELSGGQQRRVGLARTLVVNPKIVLFDEPTAGLDLSVQATVIKLLRDLKDQYGLTYLFVSHDLSVVRRLCNRIIIMRYGKIVESGHTETITTAPASEYTRTLLDAVPSLLHAKPSDTRFIEPA